jgi:hypothetical protein
VECLETAASAAVAAQRPAERDELYQPDLIDLRYQFSHLSPGSEQIHFDSVFSLRFLPHVEVFVAADVAVVTVVEVAIAVAAACAAVERKNQPCYSTETTSCPSSYATKVVQTSSFGK